MDSIEARVQANKALADIRFIRLKEGAPVKIGNYTPPDDLAIPVSEQDLDRSVQEGSLTLDDFLRGIARVLVAHPEHAECAPYREMYLAARPGHDRRLAAEGLELEEQKKPHEALERFGLLVGLRPDSAEAHHHVGRCHYALAEAEWPSLIDEKRAEHTRLAEHHLLKAIELDGTFPPSHYLLGIYLRRHGKLKQALAIWRRYLELAPSGAHAAAAHEAASQVEEADYLRGVFQVGKDAVEAGQNAEALRRLKEVVGRVPDWGSAWHWYGAALHRAKKHAEARAASEKAVRFAPGDPDAVNGLGECFLHEKEWDAAESCFRRALDLRENEPYFMVNLGRVYLGRGDKERAAFHIRMASKLAPPDDPVLKEALALVEKK